MKEERKRWAIRALNRLRENGEREKGLKAMDINLDPHVDNYRNLIEDGITMMLCDDKDLISDELINKISWWVDGDHNRIPILFGGYDVSTAELFVDYLIRFYIK